MVYNLDIGTVQGKILGPILYALFFRPFDEIEKLTTFANDNYILSSDKDKTKTPPYRQIKIVK